MAETIKMEKKEEEKITKYFPISPQSDLKCPAQKETPVNHVSPEIPRNEPSLPKETCDVEIKKELDYVEKPDEATTAKQTKEETEIIPEKVTRKGRGKGRGRGKKSAKARSESSGSKPKTEKKTTKEKKASKPSRVLTDYFPVRRSYRMTSTELKKQEEQDLHGAILSQCEDGLKVVEFEGKGRGVVSTKSFHRGDFVVEYHGDLIDLASAKGRESKYSKDTNIGCYMYYFEYKNKNYCVDATAESGKLGRLLNHSRSGNCKTRVVGIGDRPYLILVAARDIKPGEELLYDYGDRNKETLAAHPWLAL